MIEVGKTLPNGATVLAHRPGSGGYEIVLAFSPESSDPFITWRAIPLSGETFWGSYHQNIGDAVNDYEERP